MKRLVQDVQFTLYNWMIKRVEAERVDRVRLTYLGPLAVEPLDKINNICPNSENCRTKNRICKMIPEP